MKSIVLPNDLEEIGWSAFYYCTGLTSIVIPENVTVIGEKAFKQCGSLSYIIFKPQAEPSYCNWSFEESVFSECFDEDVEAKMYVPSRKTYQHGIEMISFDKDEYTYTGQSPEVNWRNNTPWAASMTTLGLYSSAGEYSKTFVASFTDIGQNVKIPYNYTIKKAPSELTIHNQTELASLNMGDEVFIEWTCDAPHTSLGILPDEENTSIVDIEKVIVYENGDEAPKYKMVANYVGSCELRLQAYGSPNYEPAIATIAITVGPYSETPIPCIAPIISFKDGKLQLTSATEGASIYYTLDTPDRTSDAVAENGEVELACQYIITAYASAEDYEDSKTVTATLYFIDANDGVETAIETPTRRGVVVSATDGFLTISGLNDGESVSIYSINGSLLATYASVASTATYSGTSGDIVIIKIGEQSIKVQL